MAAGAAHAADIYPEHHSPKSPGRDPSRCAGAVLPGNHADSRACTRTTLLGRGAGERERGSAEMSRAKSLRCDRQQNLQGCTQLSFTDLEFVHRLAAACFDAGRSPHRAVARVRTAAFAATAVPVKAEARRAIMVRERRCGGCRARARERDGEGRCRTQTRVRVNPKARRAPACSSFLPTTRRPAASFSRHPRASEEKIRLSAHGGAARGVDY